MKILDRYIGKTVLSSIGLVTLMLVGLQVFILFVNELDDLGRADFGLWQMAVYVLLQMPYQVYLFFPMACLLGCLIGLGLLAGNSELVVVRASGMSIAQIIMAVLKVSLVLIVVVTVLGETLVPKLAYYANERKALALSGGQALRTEQGVWLRQGNDFISIGSVIDKNQLANVYQYRFDDNHQLRLARHIETAHYDGKHWLAEEVAQTKIYDDKTRAEHFKTLPWPVTIVPNLLNLTGNEPDEMNLMQLYRFIKAQRASRQSVANYEIAFWQRLIQPLTTCVMIFIAIPFIFGSLRSSSMGSRLLVGALFGFGFNILNRFFAPLSQVYQIPPLVSAIGPTLLFAILAAFLLKRVR